MKANANHFKLNRPQHSQWLLSEHKMDANDDVFRATSPPRRQLNQLLLYCTRINNKVNRRNIGRMDELGFLSWSLRARYKRARKENNVYKIKKLLICNIKPEMYARKNLIG